MFSRVAPSIFCWAANPVDVLLKSPWASAVCSNITFCAAKTFCCAVNALLPEYMPSSVAAAFKVASSSSTPYLRNGSASPRSAEPNAFIASSTDVLLNDAKSLANTTRSILKSDRSLPAKPADLPKMANWPAAFNAAVSDRPKARLAVCAKFSTSLEMAPKTTVFLLMASLKSDAFLIAELANAATATTAAPIAAPAIIVDLLKSPNAFCA